MMIEKTERQPKGMILEPKMFEGFINSEGEKKFIWDETEEEHKIELFHMDKEINILQPTKKVN